MRSATACQIESESSASGSSLCKLLCREDMEDVEAAFYEAWEDAGLANEAPPRAKGSRPSSQKKRKVVSASSRAFRAFHHKWSGPLADDCEPQRRCQHQSLSTADAGTIGVLQAEGSSAKKAAKKAKSTGAMAYGFLGARSSPCLHETMLLPGIWIQVGIVMQPTLPPSAVALSHVCGAVKEPSVSSQSRFCRAAADAP